MEIPSLKITKRTESPNQLARDAILQGIIRKVLKLGQPLKKASLVQAFNNMLFSCGCRGDKEQKPHSRDLQMGTLKINWHKSGTIWFFGK